MVSVINLILGWLFWFWILWTITIFYCILMFKQSRSKPNINKVFAYNLKIVVSNVYFVTYICDWIENSSKLISVRVAKLFSVGKNSKPHQDTSHGLWRKTQLQRQSKNCYQIPSLQSMRISQHSLFTDTAGNRFTGRTKLTLF